MLALFVLVAATAGDEIAIYRDAYGVPSIVASNVADACYGLGYACGQDNAEKMALTYKLARGRLAEVQGKSQLFADGFIRSLGFEDLAADKAEHLTRNQEALIDGYLEGANRALDEQKGKLPDWIKPFTRTDVLALAQFVNAAFPLMDIANQLMPGTGSNQFAVAPSRSATGHPILSMDPHLEWNGPLTWYEYAWYTPELKFRGMGIPGAPLPIMGHTDRVAWSMTNNDPDIFEFFVVKTNPENRSQYSYHGEWKPFIDSEIELNYLEDGTMKTQKQRSRKTIWGPMVPLRPQAVYLSMIGSWEVLDTFDQITRSKSAREARAALDRQGPSMWNFVFADVDGNIAYQYNARVRRRDASLDWSKPIDGSDPKTKLGPLVPENELPRVENPASGLLVNCNSAPWLTPVGKEISDSWPTYITSYGHTTRYDRLSALLAADHRITIEKAKAYATDTLVPNASQAISELARTKPASSDGQPLGVLQRWSKRADISAVGCALYAYWCQDGAVRPLVRKAGQGSQWTPDEAAKARSSLAAAAEKMKKDHGTLLLPWGDLHVAQRGGWTTPVIGTGFYGTVNSAVAPNDGPIKDGRQICNFGSSWRMIVSLEPGNVQSWSALPYGQSNDPKNPHYADQMGLFGRGEYKPTRFGLDGAKQSARHIDRLKRG